MTNWKAIGRHFGREMALEDKMEREVAIGNFIIQREDYKAWAYSLIKDAYDKNGLESGLTTAFDLFNRIQGRPIGELPCPKVIGLGLACEMISEDFHDLFLEWV